MELAKRILAYRVSNNIKQEEMAKLLKIGSHTLSDIEQGKKVSMKTQVKVELKLYELEKKSQFHI